MTRRLSLLACTVDLETGALSDGRSGRRTTRERDRLCFLVDRVGSTVAREVLTRDVFGYRAGTKTRAVDKAMSQLRAKVEADPGSPKHLISVQGLGYRFAALLSVADDRTGCATWAVCAAPADRTASRARPPRRRAVDGPGVGDPDGTRGHRQERHRAGGCPALGRRWPRSLSRLALGGADGERRGPRARHRARRVGTRRGGRHRGGARQPRGALGRARRVRAVAPLVESLLDASLLHRRVTVHGVRLELLATVQACQARP